MDIIIFKRKLNKPNKGSKYLSSRKPLHNKKDEKFTVSIILSERMDLL